MDEWRTSPPPVANHVLYFWPMVVNQRNWPLALRIQDGHSWTKAYIIQTSSTALSHTTNAMILTNPSFPPTPPPACYQSSVRFWGLAGGRSPGCTVTGEEKMFTSGLGGEHWPEVEKCGWGWRRPGHCGKVQAPPAFVKLLGIQALRKQTRNTSP